MPHVFIPPGLRAFADGHQRVEVEGETVQQVIDNLDSQFPGFAAHLVQSGSMRPGWTVVVGGSIAALGLRQHVGPDAEIHFLPALGGG